MLVVVVVVVALLPLIEKVVIAINVLKRKIVYSWFLTALSATIR